MFDQIEPRTLNSVQLTDAAIKPNCTANITALLLLAIEPIIDLSPTRKKLSDETKQQKKRTKTTNYVYLCMSYPECGLARRSLCVRRDLER